MSIYIYIRFREKLLMVIYESENRKKIIKKDTGKNRISIKVYTSYW